MKEIKTKELEFYREKVFDDIKHIDEGGHEFWYARELMPLLEYNRWENFHKVIKKAMVACETSNNKVLEHFPQVGKTIPMPKGTSKVVDDYKLSRYACYLIVQNADPRKKAVALGKNYIAIQTRKQEIQGNSTKNDILDNADIYELATNLFIRTLTEQKIKNENIKGEENIKDAYNHVSKEVKSTFERLGGTPEDASLEI